MATSRSKSKPRPPMNFDRTADPPQPIGTASATPQAVRKDDPEISGSSHAPGKPGPSDTKFRQASRVGKRAVTFYVSPDAFRQLGVFAAQSDRTVQDLMQEALDMLFQHHGLHRIAKE